MREGIELNQTLLKQSADILKATREKSGLTGSSMPTSYLVVFTGACLETDFMYLHKRPRCKVSAF